MQRLFEISLRAIFGVFGVLGLIASVSLFLTNIDLAALDIPEEHRLEQVEGEICQFHPQRRGLEISICGIDSLFILSSRTRRVDDVFLVIQPGQHVELSIYPDGESTSQVFRIAFDGGESIVSYGEIKKRYFRSELILFLLSLVTLLGSFFMLKKSYIGYPS